jgi:hypothetical protein
MTCKNGRPERIATVAERRFASAGWFAATYFDPRQRKHVQCAFSMPLMMNRGGVM